MKQKKILLVTEYFPPKIFGGGEISAYNLAKALVKKKLDVTVLTSKFKELKQNEKKDGFRILRKLQTGNGPYSILENVKRNIYFQKSLKKEIKNMEEEYDVIHFLNTTSIPSFRLNKKTIATINNYTNFCPKSNLFYKEKEVCDGCNPTKFVGCITNSKYIGKLKLRLWMKYNPLFWVFLYVKYLKNKSKLKNIDRFTIISDFLSYYLEKNNIKKKKITTIPNIIDLEIFTHKKRNTSKKLQILYLGDYSVTKGPEILLKALKNVNFEYECNFFGEGYLKEFLEREIRKNNLNVKVHKKLEHKNIPLIINQHDVVVFPSKWPEPFGRIIIESLACGKPVIASSVGGIKELILHGKTGFLFEQNNHLELKKFLDKLNETTVLKRMSLQSNKHLKRLYSAETIASKVIKVYKA